MALRPNIALYLSFLPDGKVATALFLAALPHEIIYFDVDMESTQVTRLDLNLHLQSSYDIVALKADDGLITR